MALPTKPVPAGRKPVKHPGAAVVKFKTDGQLFPAENERASVTIRCANGRGVSR